MSEPERPRVYPDLWTVWHENGTRPDCVTNSIEDARIHYAGAMPRHYERYVSESRLRRMAARLRSEVKCDGILGVLTLNAIIDEVLEEP